MAMVTMTRMEPFIHSDAADPALAEQARARGYLFLPGLLPAARLDALRERLQGHLCDDGWCDHSCPPRARPGLGAPAYEDQRRFMRVYKRCYAEPLFHELPHHPALRRVLETVVGAPLLVHPRHILRVQTPGSQRYSTPPHQDCFYIGGSLDTWTAWIPLSDCPRELGPLAVQAGSHRLGPLPVHRAEGAGEHAVDADDAAWHQGGFALGDVLLMHGCLIHQALDNETSDRIRLSVDLRYQHAHAPVHPSSLEPHLGVCSWEEAYAGWPADHPLRRYWRSFDLDIQTERNW